MIIFSHRGIGFGKKEGSLESFITALKEGFSLEIDLRKTKDDVLVISHDANLKRLCGDSREISEINYIQLKEFIPSFLDVCLVFKKFKIEGQKLALHLKDKEISTLNLVLREILKEKIENDCFIFDIPINYLNLIQYEFKSIEIGLSLGEKRFSETIYLWDDLKNEERFNIVWWDEWSNGLYNQINADSIREMNKLIYAISPELHLSEHHPQSKNLEDIKKIWKELVALKVDGICTDYPRELGSLLNTKINS